MSLKNTESELTGYHISNMMLMRFTVSRCQNSVPIKDRIINALMIKVRQRQCKKRFGRSNGTIPRRISQRGGKALHVDQYKAILMQSYPPLFCLLNIVNCIPADRWKWFVLSTSVSGQRSVLLIFLGTINRRKRCNFPVLEQGDG